MRQNLSTDGGAQAPSDREFFLTAQQLRVQLLPDTRFGSDASANDRNQRDHKRSLRSISVSVQPLDDDFQPCGDLFWVVSRDVSLHGMGLISHEAFSHKYVRLGLMDLAVSTIAQVRHNTSIGEKYPLYLVGVRFEGHLLGSDGNLRSS